jgi:hypothetical protein
MSDLIKDFYSELSSITEVSSFAGSRIYPLVARAGSEDFIVYTPIAGGYAETYYSGNLGMSEVIVQVDVYSRSFATNQTVVEAIINYFNGFTGVLNTNSIVGRAYVSAKREDLDPSDSTLYRSSIDINITYN